MTTFNSEMCRLVVQAAHEEGIRVTSKDIYRGWWELANLLMRIITFGYSKNVVTDYTSAIGDTVYFPAGWTEEKATQRDYVTLRHELEHVRQYRRLGFGNIWLGFAFFAVLYLLLPLPTIFAWFRYKYEREAYLESWRAARDLDLDIHPEVYVTILTGPDYVWAWPFKGLVRKWFAKRTGV